MINLADADQEIYTETKSCERKSLSIPPRGSKVSFEKSAGFPSNFCDTLHHTADPTMGDDEDVPVSSGIGRGRGRGGVPVLPAGTKLVERDS